MKIRRLLILCLAAFMTVLPLTACGDKEGETQTDTYDTADAATPLSNKEFPDARIKSTKDFKEVVGEVLTDYINCVNSYSEYTQAHEYEFAQGMTVKQIPGYQDSFECWYEWFYKISSVDDDDVPDEFKSIWQHFKNMAMHNKPRLDEVYSCNVNDMAIKMDEVLEYDSTEVEAIQTEYSALLTAE